ncbi:MAG: peptide-methionine (R)-S-oxide reductase MsrB [Proteobacteria bacterium]|nr:peptide-methionine (R)-S-oxide reductase MsrB [Pseudomonadota bacterium]MBU1596510.1 peptide-methionine (R)-S-oxide reductase MsrB [Pseudomonadota bacterium]
MKTFLTALALLLALAATAGAATPGKAQEQKGAAMSTDTTALATFAGGCFWCVESDFAHLPGVVSVTSGYAGGAERNPTYKQVSAGQTGHLEAAQIRFDPAKVSYLQLLEWFWRHHDPTDAGGQFCDRGNQYRPAVFTHSEEQRREAEESKKRLADSRVLARPVITPILAFTTFYPAEDYHQRYFEKNPVRYTFYRFNCGRDKTIKGLWGSEAEKPFSAYTPAAVAPGAWRKPSREQLKATLTPLQFKVTQEEGTEPPFTNEYDTNKREGIYVDIVSGEALFSSRDKYDSGTGWPSFVRPLEPGNIVEREDRTLFSVRTEIRSRLGDNHLGHVFTDGPKPTGLRYCMNSAALRFVPRESLEKEGYGKYAGLFAK